MSKIEWTERTWNCLVGCTKVPRVGEGLSACAHCYAMGDAPHRFPGVYEREGVIKIGANAKRPGLTYVPSARVKASERRGRSVLERHDDGTLSVSLGKGPQWTGEVRCLPWKLDEPLRRRKPTKYFVNSLADIFHEKLVGCEDGRRFIAAIFGVFAACPQHTFQLLTKRDPRPWFEWAAAESCPGGGPHYFEPKYPNPALVTCAHEAGGRADLRAHNRSVPWQRVVNSTSWPLPNVWLGVSVEDQAAAAARIPWLLDTPAAVRWLSVEPMLGPVDLGGRLRPGESWDGFDVTGYREDAPLFDSRLEAEAWMREHAEGSWRVEERDDDDRHPEQATPGLDWVVCGGESGPGARPMHPDWARSMREQCRQAGVAFHFKQWGAWAEVSRDDPGWTHMVAPDGRTFARGEDLPWDVVSRMGDVAFMRRVGKKVAGRELDGRTWDEFPEGAP